MPLDTLSLPPENVRSQSAISVVDPYTFDPSTKAVISLNCSLGLAAEVPVPGAGSLRRSGIRVAPIPKGSKSGSPCGTGIKRFSLPLGESVRS